MKKKNVFLFVLSLLLSIFVSAQDTSKLGTIDIKLDSIVLVKGETKITKKGEFHLIFTSNKGEVFFRDNQENSLMTIQLAELIEMKPLNVKDGDSCIEATALVFNATANKKFEIIYSIVLRDSDKSLYACGITLGDFTILIKIPKDGAVTK